MDPLFLSHTHLSSGSSNLFRKLRSSLVRLPEAFPAIVAYGSRGSGFRVEAGQVAQVTRAEILWSLAKSDVVLWRSMVEEIPGRPVGTCTPTCLFPQACPSHCQQPSPDANATISHHLGDSFLRAPPLLVLGYPSWPIFLWASLSFTTRKSEGGREPRIQDPYFQASGAER